MLTDNMIRPEIHWNRKQITYEQDGKPITNAAAINRWEACDSDWSMSAHKRMQAMILHGTRPENPCHDAE